MLVSFHETIIIVLILNGEMLCDFKVSDGFLIISEVELNPGTEEVDENLERRVPEGLNCRDE
jgi:hypothetical protein